MRFGRLKGSAPDLVVVGSSATAEFERMARRLGVADRVRFAGYCPDMRDAYFAADLLVHPTFYDPCSNVVLEAMACGLPVITMRSNGASEMLRPIGPRGECAEGLVLDDPHNHACLAWCLEQLLDPVRRAGWRRRRVRPRRGGRSSITTRACWPSWPRRRRNARRRE